MKAIGSVPRRTALGAVLGLFTLTACSGAAEGEKPEAPEKAAPTRLTSAPTTPAKDPWFLAGSRKQDYAISTAPDPSEAGRLLRTLRHVAPTIAEGQAFGTVMQTFSAEKYRGKRVRFSANVETKAVTSWAGLWMRVDANRAQRSFDNMEGRPIKGTTAKTRYDVVLDVTDDATAISLGVLVEGPGEATLSSASIEIVDASVPVTSPPPKALGDFQP